MKESQKIRSLVFDVVDRKNKVGRPDREWVDDM